MAGSEATMTDTISERHVNGGAYMTNTCQHGPHLTDADGLCDTEQMRRERDEWAAATLAKAEALLETREERDAEAAHAKALAEALRDIEASPQTLDSRLRREARKALAAYEAAHPKDEA
jgi:hypothetical protein